MSVCQGCGIELPPSRGGPPRKWCSERCRRHTVYSRPCLDCGKPTYNGTNPPPERCSPCTNHARIIWTEDAVLGAIRAWARESGGIPPAATDWNPSHAITIGRPEKAEKYYDDDTWPHVTTVQERFGSWSAAIAAAGFSPRAPSTYGRDGEDMGLCREIRERYEAGESLRALTAEYACGREAIVYRVVKAGGRRRGRSEARRLAWEQQRRAAA